ncbi:ABC transporter, ATP-binding protein [Leptospira fainei serovar Hurstbridge str. BUT 6]|uniref:Transport permease protein n=1 Tax=Leptospira fainei serovar Hurstbridge str. BUT 6 TaxID=1193011 RepID=S3W7H9_9LEPT|nr:ABC transporter permease [Leptospira fainei]EPG76037.1 ABC transporter, ATP-binding protein [Leptospira fainei serovar Hurstbridge str. BUT 6]
MISNIIQKFGKPEVVDQKWDLVIRPKEGLFSLHLADLWNYKDLIFLFVKRDFISLYKQTILGPLWYIVQPLASTVIYTIIFGKIANVSTDGVPHFIFYLSGTVLWSYFADCLIATSNTFVANAGIFSKVYFPRLAVPVSIVVSSLIKFAIQFATFLAFYFYFILKGATLEMQWSVILLPIFILQIAILGLGFGVMVSSMTTKYRDLSLLVAFGVQLWMYATPVVYPLSLVPEQFKLLYNLNPMANLIENFRFSFLGHGHLDLYAWAQSWIITVLVFFIGIVIFSRAERDFVDTV